jgi:hypothetical protein
MTYEIINGWIVGEFRGPDDELIPVKHYPSTTVRTKGTEPSAAVPAYDRDSRLRS